LNIYRGALRINNYYPQMTKKSIKKDNKKVGTFIERRNYSKEVFLTTLQITVRLEEIRELQI